MSNFKIQSPGSRWGLVLVLAGVVASGVAFAQAASPIQISNAVYQEVEVKAPDGKITKKLVPAAKVVPGGEVVYQIDVVNTGKVAATDVAIDNAVPAGLTLSDDSKSPPSAVSVDAGKTYGELAKLTVPGEDGKPRAAQLSDVTHMRWVLAQVAPGAKNQVMFRARVK